MSSPSTPTLSFLLQAHNLSGGPCGQAVFEPLSFSWPAGLNWVCGDEGCGKTTLLRLLAGDLLPLNGSIETPPGGVFWLDLQGAAHDETTVQACWDKLQAHYPHWNNALLQDLSEALNMTSHRHKRLNMLSTGSRRKVMLVAALASGAAVTLLDQPFVSLDQVSIRLIKDFLTNTASQPDRAWIVADYEAPEGLVLASLLEL
ncbi:hypothetical protein B9Z45_08435 [Limnohabitans sp. 2KL-17]|uniref:ABC transporter ATP-binding protein n=1 Tax=Limnohabitans sp. 2KL-17 TaxID=1100704 RepID=UPI000D34D2DE|nr:ATP-binding cassette domain-containing protein [Limnohabitans sp. 2KL-17]PUE57252.1 hypothetical protein B9Z45_08435 [Limnohabitans sp. 2KL-17]